MRSGLRLFQALLSADEEIASKTDTNGALRLAVVYIDDRKLATELAERLGALSQGKKGRIRNLPVTVEVRSERQLSDSLSVAAGVYVVEALSGAELERVVRYGVDNHVIVYTPFASDVPKGVLSGMIVDTRVRPHINIRTMRQSQLRIKPFFLKVAVHYEP